MSTFCQYNMLTKKVPKFFFFIIFRKFFFVIFWIFKLQSIKGNKIKKLKNPFFKNLVFYIVILKLKMDILKMSNSKKFAKQFFIKKNTKNIIFFFIMQKGNKLFLS